MQGLSLGREDVRWLELERFGPINSNISEQLTSFKLDRASVFLPIGAWLYYLAKVLEKGRVKTCNATNSGLDGYESYL